MATQSSGEKRPATSEAAHTHENTDQPCNACEEVWDGDCDPRRPRNWSSSRKWTATFILSGFAFIQPLAETMLAPVQNQISDALHIRSEGYQWILVNSLILIGVGFGPLFLAPLSEIYGRKPVLLGGSAVFIIWNIGCGFAQNLEQMLPFRLLAGFGACVADAVAGGVIGDLWEGELRGRAFAVYMLAPLVGPGLGPIIGAYIATGSSLSWRWIFWITSIASAVIFCIAIFFFQETYEPRLAYRLQRHSKIRAGSLNHQTVSGHTEKSAIDAKKIGQLLRTNLQRPIRMLATQIIIQLLALYMALLYGTMFLFLYMYSQLWSHKYGQSVRVSSLNYISAAIGYITGVQIAGHLNDRVFSILKARSINNKGLPEFRVPVMTIGTALIPIGLLWWGWSGEKRLHWIMPNIGCFIFTAGCYICSSCVSVYTIDAYTRYGASAVSTNLVLRSNFAAFFPLFAPYMFRKLGFGRGASILAGGFTIVGCLTLVVLWFWGEKLRKKSTYCAQNDVEPEKTFVTNTQPVAEAV